MEEKRIKELNIVYQISDPRHWPPISLVRTPWHILTKFSSIRVALCVRIRVLTLSAPQAAKVITGLYLPTHLI